MFLAVLDAAIIWQLAEDQPYYSYLRLRTPCNLRDGIQPEIQREVTRSATANLALTWASSVTRAAPSWWRSTACDCLVIAIKKSALGEIRAPK